MIGGHKSRACNAVLDVSFILSFAKYDRLVEAIISTY